MAGIYVHVPFCKVKCHYCDFHFSVQLKTRSRMVDAMLAEIDGRKDYLKEEEVKTIYFGGGTPSVLEASQLEKLLNQVYKNYTVAADAEITLEANPDDLTAEKLKIFKAFGVNRLSIGTQSFDDEVLTYMNRAHGSQQAIESILLSQDLGFRNITIDLIYGVPGSSMASWEKELKQMAALNVPHLSAYCLTIEDNTVFGNWYKKGKLQPPPDDLSLKQFRRLVEFSADLGLEQYEISNFAKSGFISKHNSAYWLGQKYLGIGPSAHSYNLKERSWNIANNGRYMKALEEGTAYSEAEELSIKDRFNDYVLTRLRTKWGINLDELHAISPSYTKAVEGELVNQINSGHLIQKDKTYYLTEEGKFLADAISSDLFQ